MGGKDVCVVGVDAGDGSLAADDAVRSTERNVALLVRSPLMRFIRNDRDDEMTGGGDVDVGERPSCDMRLAALLQATGKYVVHFGCAMMWQSMYGNEAKK